MSEQTHSTPPVELRKSQGMQDFENLMERLVHDATAADREKIADLINPESSVRIEELTPAYAALLFVEGGGHNRDFSLTKAKALFKEGRVKPRELNRMGLKFVEGKGDDFKITPHEQTVRSEPGEVADSA